MTKIQSIGLLVAAAVVVVGGIAIAFVTGIFDQTGQQPKTPVAGADKATESPAEPAAGTEVAATDKPAAESTIAPPPLNETVTRDAPPVGDDQATAALAAGLQFDVVRVEPSGDAVIAGRAAPNSKVGISASGKIVATATADASGDWVVVLDEPLPAGTSDLAILSMSGDDTPIAESEERIAVMIPEGGQGEVLIVKQAPGAVSEVIAKPETAVAALDIDKAPETPAGSEQAAAAATTPPEADDPPAEPETAVAADPQIGIEVVEVEGDRLRLSGIADPGATVRVYVDNLHIGDAKVGADGRWSLSVRAAVDAGRHTVRVDNVRVDDGAVVARAEAPFVKEQDAVAVGEVEIVARGEAQIAELGEASGATAAKSVEIRRGDNLWRIARKLWGRGIRYTSIYDANRGQIRNPHLIYPGQIFLIPKVADAAEETATSTE